METRRQREQLQSTYTHKLCNKAELLERYKDKALVDRVISGKRKAGLATEDPDAPGEEEAELYYCRVEVKAKEQHTK